MTPRALAIKLMTDHGDEMARAVHRLATKLEPRWGAVDPDAFAMNGRSLIGAVVTYLDNGQADQILMFAREAMVVRKLSGFSARDFNVLMHLYLPVIRKGMIARAPTVAQGLDAYDVAESVCLALITRLIATTAAVEEITQPDAQAPSKPRAFQEISVAAETPEFMRDADDDEELTSPSGRAPGLKARR